MEAVASTVGKAALAQILGWTRPKLDRRLQSDAAFPVVQQGNQAGGWAFNPDAVKSYLGIGPKKPAK
jgi:phage terminase Nu1 subunit (DNA packaging protein)